METKYSIKDLENLSGIKAHTIRAWESRYDLLEPCRTDTNIRYYLDDHLKKILNIAVLVKGGMRISNVAKMSTEEIRSAVIDSGRYEGNYDSQINALKIAMLEYDEYLFDNIFNKCLIQFGTEETLNDILGPFIIQIGTLWQAGAINVSNEHFISNLMKQKLFAIIDQIIIPQPKSTQMSYVLYLPSEELHELSLLYLYYYLKKNGHRVVYLGQSVPIEYLKEVSDKTKIDRFISVFTSRPHFEEMDFYFERIGEMFKDDRYQFFLSGLQFKNYDIQNNIPDNVRITPSMADLKKVV